MRDVSQMSWVSRIASFQDREGYSEQHWEGIVRGLPRRSCGSNPKVTRTAFQRVYDMILSHGKTEYIDNKKKLIRYDFFTDPDFDGKDAIYGLDIPLMKLVNVFKSAAQGYGTEKRVILPARPGRLVEVDDRAAPQEGARGVLEEGRRARSTPSPGTSSGRTSRACGARSSCPARCTRSRCTSSRTSGAPKIYADLAARLRATRSRTRATSAPPAASSTRS